MNDTTQTIPVQITCGVKTFDAILYQNPTSLSLLDQMPFTAEMEDYGGVEKIFYPEEKLNKEGAPAGADPEIGDIMCYGPWGNVVLFYGEFGYAGGLIPLGHIEDISGLIQEIQGGNKTVTFKKAK